MTDVTHAFRRIDGTLRRVDGVLFATLGLFAVLTLAVPAQSLASLNFTLRALLFIAPFFLLSVAVAAGAKASGADRQIAVVFSGRANAAIVLAALFGALSPFCSCGVMNSSASTVKFRLANDWAELDRDVAG